LNLSGEAIGIGLSNTVSYGGEHDESYLPGDDFIFSSDQPSYVLIEGDSVVGAVSLIRTQSHVDAKKGRFSVFHSIVSSVSRYSRLYQAICRHFDGLDKVYLFIPREKQDVAIVLAELGFRSERLSFVLSLPKVQERQIELEDGFNITSVSKGDRAGIEAFVEVMDRNFRGSSGYVEITADEVKSWFDEDTYVENGVTLLYSGDIPIGTGCLFREDGSDSGVIEFLSVREGFRGRGLGRRLLRHEINLATTNGLTSIYLSVNGENDLALGLYLSEGFKLEKTVVCYSRNV
jgi:mycothiol synthase